MTTKDALSTFARECLELRGEIVGGNCVADRAEKALAAQDSANEPGVKDTLVDRLAEKYRYMCEMFGFDDEDKTMFDEYDATKAGGKWVGEEFFPNDPQRETAQGEVHDPAPTHSLPSWEDCALRVDNSNFVAKRVAEGGYCAEPDAKLANDLHCFIYEYDDQDRHKSAWFMHRLELALKAASPPTRAPGIELPLMRQAFRTTVSSGLYGRYEMVFKFKTLEDMQAADHEWIDAGVRAEVGK